MGVSVEGNFGFPCLMIDDDNLCLVKAEDFTGSVVSLELSLHQARKNKEMRWSLEVYGDSDCLTKQYWGDLQNDGPEEMMLDCINFPKALRRYSELSQTEFERWLCQEALCSLTRRYTIDAEIFNLTDGGYGLNIHGVANKRDDDFCWEYLLQPTNKIDAMERDLHLSRGASLLELADL